MYEAQSWIYNLINVVPVWEQGYTGSGVQVAINDDGIDLTMAGAVTLALAWHKKRDALG